MKQNQKLIQGLQKIVTDLSQQANRHNIESKIFYSQGFSKLGKNMQNTFWKKEIMLPK